MTNDLMTPEEYVKAARVLAEGIVDVHSIYGRHDDEFLTEELAIARKVLSQTPRGIVDKFVKDSKLRRGVGPFKPDDKENDSCD